MTASSHTQPSSLPAWLVAVRHVTRLDARSLGLFRIAFGFVLIADLITRYRYVVEFYSNEGVLPNHTHLNGLKQDGKSVWSAFHAFNSAGEARVGMYVVLFIYLCFVLGWKTRAFQVLSLVSLVSLGARNLLAESWGNWIGVSILAFSVALPLGSRFSIDALLKGSRDATEVDADDLNHRTRATELAVDARRAVGWSPMSFAAVGFLLQLVVVYVCLAQNQADAWKDGTALDKFLHVHRLASPTGFLAPDAHPASLKTLTQVIYWLQYAIPILLFVPLPFLRGPTRLVAAAGMLVHGIALGLLFNFGMFGWALAACAFAVLSADTWDGWMKKHSPARARTVVYDADCGICFWLAKFLKRLDAGRHLTFQGNDSLFETSAPAEDEGEPTLGSYWIVGPDGEKQTRPLPGAITPTLVEQTIVVIDAKGRYWTNGEAVVQILQALPGFRVLAFLSPLFVLDALYGIIAPRRTRISVACGLDACGAIKKPADHVPDPLERPIAPSKRMLDVATVALREGWALVILAAMLSQTKAENPKFPVAMPRVGALTSVAWYLRMIDRWDVLAEVPTEQGMFVTDAVTQDNTSIDTFTGKVPVVDFAKPFELGQMWSDYLYRVTQDPKYATDPKYQGYPQQLKTYLQKSGPRWVTEQKEKKITALDAYWVTTTVPAGEWTLTRIARVGRGGVVLSDPTQSPAPFPGQSPLQQGPTPFPGGPPLLRQRPQE